MKPPLLASRARFAAAAACGLSLLVAACSSGASAPPPAPEASPPATTVPIGKTTDKGRRTLVPSAIGQLAPEDMPTAPPSGR